MNAHKHRAKSLLHSNSSTKVWAVCRYWFGAGKHFPFLIVVTVIHIVAAKLNVSLLLCYENYCCEQQSVAIYCTLRSLCLSFTVFNFHFFFDAFLFWPFVVCVCPIRLTITWNWIALQLVLNDMRDMTGFVIVVPLHHIRFVYIFTNFVLWETNLCAHKCW